MGTQTRTADTTAENLALNNFTKQTELTDYAHTDKHETQWS